MTDVVALLSDLVAINSANGSMPDGPGEAELARFVAGFGERIGAVVAMQEALPGRPNVLLTLPATANGGAAAATGGRLRRLLFDVHMDTVPLEPMPDALRPTIRDGRLWGRGACDTKASLAATLVALERLAARRERQAEVCLLATVDEEYRKRGAAYAVQQGITADAAIVGEPTNLRPVVAHKGAVRWRMTTIGRAAHTSRPENGINAIYLMVTLIEALRERLEPPLSLQRHPLLTPPTLTIGRIEGGVGVNVVPERCSIEIDRRTLPGEDPAVILAEVDRVVADLSAHYATIQVERGEPFLSERGLETAPDAPVVAAAQRACRAALGAEADVSPAGVPYGTDGTLLWAEAGMPAVVLGPGDIAQAHSADEWVEVAQVEQAVEVYHHLMAGFVAGEW